MKNKNLINAFSGLIAFTLPVIALIFTTPYLINKLGAESYGLINVTSLVISYLLLIDCAYEVVLTKNVAVTKEGLVNVVSNSFTVYLTLGLIGIFLVVFFGYPYAFYFVNIDNSERFDFYLCILSTGFSFFALMIYTWSKSISNGLGNYLDANVYYVLFNLIGVLIGASLVYLGFGYLEYVFSRTFVWLIFVPIYIYYIKKKIVNFHFNFSYKAFIDYLHNIKNGFWLRLSEQFLSRADQLLITILYDLKTVAYFSASFIIFNAATMLVRKMVEFVLPKFSELHSNNDKFQLSNTFLEYFNLTVSIAAFVFGFILFIGNDLLSIWLGETFASNINIIYFNMILGGFISSISIIILSYYLISIDKYSFYTKYLTFKSCLYLVLFYVLSIFLGFTINSVSSLFILNGIVDLIYFFYSLKYIKLKKTSIFNVNFIGYIIIIMTVAILFNLKRGLLNVDYSILNLMILSAVYVTFYIFVSLVFKYPNNLKYFKKFNKFN